VARFGTPPPVVGATDPQSHAGEASGAGGTRTHDLRFRKPFLSNAAAKSFKGLA